MHEAEIMKITHAKFVCGFRREVMLFKITAKVMASCLYTHYYRKYNTVYFFTCELLFSNDRRESIHICDSNCTVYV